MLQTEDLWNFQTKTLATFQAKIVGNNTYVCVSGGKKGSFFGKFDLLCFFETPVFGFALLPYYRWSDVFGGTKKEKTTK